MSEALEKAEALRLFLALFLLISSVFRPNKSLNLCQIQGSMAVQKDLDKLQEQAGSSVL